MKLYNYFLTVCLVKTGLVSSLAFAAQERKPREKFTFQCDTKLQRKQKRDFGKYEKGVLYYRDNAHRVCAQTMFYRGQASRDAAKTANLQQLLVLPGFGTRNQGLARALFFQDAPQILSAAGFEKMKWRAHPFTVDEFVTTLPVPALYDQTPQETEIAAIREKRCYLELSEAEYNHQLPRLCAFFERHGAVAAKKADGSYICVKDPQTGRDEVEFMLDLKQHLARSPEKEAEHKE